MNFDNERGFGNDNCGCGNSGKQCFTHEVKCPKQCWEECEWVKVCETKCHEPVMRVTVCAECENRRPPSPPKCDCKCKCKCKCSCGSRKESRCDCGGQRSFGCDD